MKSLLLNTKPQPANVKTDVSISLEFPSEIIARESEAACESPIRKIDFPDL
jgi:hypothetical protein